MSKLTLDTQEQVFFYEQDFYVLSNFSSFAINKDSFNFPTAEHLYHYIKFDYLPSNHEERNSLIKIKDSIAKAKSAHEAFKIAQDHKYFRDPNWDEVKFSKMLSILRLKVEQHEYVKKKLLETGDRELIENSWRDDVWGWGENRDGKNALGKLWMLVREEVKVLNSLNAKDLKKDNFVSLFDRTGVNFLIENLQIGDEIYKRVIKDNQVISCFKIFLVTSIPLDDSVISFTEYTQDKENKPVGTHVVQSLIGVILSFLNQYKEDGSDIGMFRN
jgi:ribA/ribD-fused uncharacterized protein